MKTPALTQTVELVEYDTRQCPSASPTASDLRLASRLTGVGGDPKLTVDFLAGGDVRVSATSWVGVVRFTHLEVHVVPKLVGGALKVLGMVEYAHAVDILRHLPAHRQIAPEGDNIRELVLLLLTEEARRLIATGLIRDYHTVEDTLSTLRGRLRHREQVMRRFGLLDKLECVYDEYDGDVAENQFVAAALQVGWRCTADARIRAILSRVADVFYEVCDPPTFDAESYERRIQYGRRNAGYRSAHLLAGLVLRAFALDDLYEFADPYVTAFLIDMNPLFEQFVTRLVKDSLVGTPLRVMTQASTGATIRNDRANRPYATIRPDLVIENPSAGRRIPIDIKYKTYDERKISSADIYQTFLYAYALEPDDIERRAAILYPKTIGSPGPRLSVRGPSRAVGARISGAAIDVSATLDSLRKGTFEETKKLVRAGICEITGLDAAAKTLLDDLPAAGLTLASR